MDNLFAGAATVALCAGAMAFASTYQGLGGFLQKWAVYAVVITGFIAAGVVLGFIMRGAMCASIWMCN